MTGGGYGAFSWGTSLSTVYEQTSGLKLFKDAPALLAGLEGEVGDRRLQVTVP